jgi:ankyrin repeat protein
MRKRTLVLLIALFSLARSPLSMAGVYDDILVAARDNRADIVISLLRRGMDPNTSDQTGTTLLMFSARHGNLELTDFLLNGRANVRKRNRFGDTAIGIAALGGHLQMVRRLVEAGADFGGPGWNPLHYAAFGGHADIVRYLASVKAPLDDPAPNHQTALMLAARNGHLEVVRVLIDADADMDLEDGEGNTALSIARKACNQAIADYLKGEGAVE